MNGFLKLWLKRTMNEGRTDKTVSLALVVICLLVTAGCGGGSPDRTSRINAEEGRRVFDGGAPVDSVSNDGATSDPARATAGGWGIMLEHFSGPGHVQSADRRAAELTSMLGRRDVRVVRRKSGSAVVLGSYPGPSDQRAVRDLAFVHGFDVQGRKPFARSFFAPPQTVTDPGRIPELNLLSAREKYGPRAEYTLQIGVYESSNRAEAKAAAEQAAARLRSEGELAFYHHGQFRSMVTVGVFDASDYDERVGIRNPQLIELKNRYPLNLLNGQYPIIVKRPGVPETKQRSMLVQIPD